MASESRYLREIEESAQGTDLFEAPGGDDLLMEGEESAQGTDLFEAPGGRLMAEDARDQAEASGWIPEKAASPDPGRLARAMEHHVTLRDAMVDMERVIGRPVAAPDWADLVGEALREIEGALEDHMADVEQADGLLADVEAKAPRLIGEVGLLRDEHGALRRSAEQARTALRGGSALGGVGLESARRRVMALLGRLMLHRQRAADMVYEAYNVDIAAAD